MRALLIGWLHWFADVIEVPDAPPAPITPEPPLPLLVIDLGDGYKGKPRLGILAEDFEKVAQWFGRPPPYRYNNSTACLVAAYIEQVWVMEDSGWVEYKAAVPVPKETVYAHNSRLEIGYAASRLYVDRNARGRMFNKANYDITEVVVKLLKAEDRKQELQRQAEDDASYVEALKIRADELFGATPTQ